MSLIMTLPKRLAMMLKDCNENIVEAYYLHQDNLDYVERPSWIITSGEATYSVGSNTSADQAEVEESYELFLVGEPIKGVDQEYGYYEEQTRKIANDAIIYLLRHPNLQFSNSRGLEDDTLPNLEGVLWMRPQSRSPIAIQTREGIEEQFWGFSISINVRSIILDEEGEIVISGG